MELKERFIHRDLSWLEFNRRVLNEAEDSRNPLLERLRFLAIFSSNLDEFYMVRVAGIKRLMTSGYNKKDQFGYYPSELLTQIKSKADSLLAKLYAIYDESIKPELESQKIFIKNPQDLTESQRKFVKRYFDSTLFPIITPMAVDGGRPFPVLLSKTIALAVGAERSNKRQLAIIPVPKSVPRILKIPSEADENIFVLIDDIIKENLKDFFKGYKIADAAGFRVLRDSELDLDEEFAPDLLKLMEREIKKRSVAKAVYLPMEQGTSKELITTLTEGIGFDQDEVVFIKSQLDLTFLHDLASLVDRPDLRFSSLVPVKVDTANIFERIANEDFIIHVPFQSFYPTIELITQAANDPDVLAIKMTLYRANEDSAIINALKIAAKKGKQVTVVVELKARFEEEKNIQWARDLEHAGCHVIYGIAGMKIHSKMTLIIRREDGRIRRYVHLSTGNYNEKTAGVYTDIGFFTANDDVARDIADVFNVITGYSQPSPCKVVVSSAHNLRKYFFDLIDREIASHKEHKNGLIWAKMNSLEDMAIIEKLYEASQAGVKIRLLVRGICCLIPGVKGLSEGIEVRSVVGRFLEHSRIFVFHQNGSPRVYLSSADWMGRNFDRRIEILFEITKQEIKSHLQFILDNYWKDTRKARVLNADRSYSLVKKESNTFNVQDYFIQHYH